MSRLARDLHAAAWLTWILLVRLLREGLIVRSLAWPPALTAATILGTALVVALTRQPKEVVLSPDLIAEQEGLEALGWSVRVEADPAAWAGQVTAATDGLRLWANGDARPVERALRKRVGAPWYPDPPPPAGPPRRTGMESLLPGFTAVLYTLYGAVFGLAATARDRDDGTLAAELALPVHRWVLGLSRWLAPAITLGAAIAANQVLYSAIFGSAATPDMLRNGFAAAGGSVALGLGAVGANGLNRGLSGPLAVALVGVAALLALGGAAPSVGGWIPIASLVTSNPGWVPLGGALVAGAAATGAFAWRSAAL